MEEMMLCLRKEPHYILPHGEAALRGRREMVLLGPGLGDTLRMPGYPAGFWTASPTASWK